MPPKPPIVKTETPPPVKQFTVTSGITTKHQKICIYGPGGAGKTTLAGMLTKVGIKPLFIDLDDGSGNIDLPGRIESKQINGWTDLLNCVKSDIVNGYDAIVIDSLSIAQEMAEAWTLANVPKIDTKGNKSFCKNLKAYGWGDGDSHLFDTFLQLLSALDRCDKHIILICHATDERVPNPAGEDYLCFMPKLAKSRQGDIRSKVRDWVDHLLFLDLERTVDEDGKAADVAVRVIYPQLLPHAWAKSRTLRETITFREGIADLWQKLFKNG